MILDKTRSRRTVARRVLLAALIPGTAALVTLAILRPDAKAQSVSTHSTKTVPSVEVTFNSKGAVETITTGGVVALTTGPNGLGLRFRIGPQNPIHNTNLFAGITDANKPGGPWWSASGTALPTPVYDTNAYRAENHASPDSNTVSFAFRLPAGAQDITVRYELPQSTQFSSDGFWPTKIQENAGRTEGQIFAQTHGTRVVTAAFPPSLAKTSLRVGIASGAWATSVHYLPPNLDNGSVTDTPGGTMVFRPVGRDSFNLTFLPNKITGDGQQQDLRLIALDVQGHKILPTLIGDKGTAGSDQINAQFNVPILQIKDIRLQTRPFQWVKYKEVALRPAP